MFVIVKMNDESVLVTLEGEEEVGFNSYRLIYTPIDASIPKHSPPPIIKNIIIKSTTRDKAFNTL